jgi:tetratricopeptide (TPR) repeat protein
LRTLKRVTPIIPIVFAGVIDPVGSGLVTSLARPGGNATGFVQFEYAIAAKWLDLIREIAPGVSRVAVLRDAAIASGIGQFAAVQTVAPVNIELTAIGLRDTTEIEQSLAAFTRASNGGMIVTGALYTVNHSDLLVALAARYKLPAVYPFRRFVNDGGLASYGPDAVDPYRQAVDYVDRILKGEKPSDLPVTVDMIVASTFMSDDRTKLLAAAEARLVKVLSLAPNHALAHVVLGHVLVSTNRADQGVAKGERALTLDRNSAGAHVLFGLAKYCMGCGAETEAHVNEAFRLSPRDIFGHRWLAIIGVSKLQISADAEALSWFRRSIEDNRNYTMAHFWLAAALALLGSLDEASAAAKEGLALVPSFTISRYRAGAYTDNQTYLAQRERICRGMCMAGLPEMPA